MPLGGGCALVGFGRGLLGFPFCEIAPRDLTGSEFGRDVPRAGPKCSSPAEAPVPGCPSGLVRANTVGARGCAEDARAREQVVP